MGFICVSVCACVPTLFSSMKFIITSKSFQAVHSNSCFNGLSLGMFLTKLLCATSVR